MKLILIILILSCSSCIIQKEKKVEGQWKPVLAQNEDGIECDQKIINAFWFKFQSGAKYEMQEKNWNGTTPQKSNGTYNINKNFLTLNYNVGRLPVSLKIPIISIGKEKMILDYNLCPLRDSISKSRLELKRIK